MLKFLGYGLLAISLLVGLAVVFTFALAVGIVLVEEFVDRFERWVDETF